MPVRATMEVKIGIFVLIALIILFVGILSIGDFYYITNPGYQINILFDFTGGVEVGAPVKMSGIKIGEVRGIDLFYDEAQDCEAAGAEDYKAERRIRAKIVAWIRGDIRVPRDSLAYVESMGLLGEKYVEITPGCDFENFLKGGQSVVGQNPVSMESLGHDLQNLTESMNEIVNRLKRGEGTLGKLLHDEDLYNNFRDLSEDIKRNPWKLLWKTREKKPKEKKETKPRSDDRDSGEGNRGYF